MTVTGHRIDRLVVSHIRNNADGPVSAPVSHS